MANWARFLIHPLFLLVVPICLSGWLIFASVSNIHLPQEWNAWIISNRSVVSFLVPSISAVITWVQTSAIFYLVQKSAFDYLKGSGLPLHRLSFFAAICKGRPIKRFGINSPWIYSALFALVLISKAIFCGTLAPLWTSALTPVVSNFESNGTIQIPHYSEDLQQKFWNQSIRSEPHNIQKQPTGSFSYSPIYAILGSILDSVASTPSLENATQIHPKIDNMGYRFLNRSYGVGAAVGFDKDIEEQISKGLSSYSFVESGYQTDVHCSYEPTMNASVKSRGSSWYEITEHLPHGSFENIILPGLTGDTEIVALLGNPSGARYAWGIVTGEKAVQYRELNLTFCEVFFQWRSFKVEVLADQRLINVLPDEDEPELTVLGPEWDNIKVNLVRQIGMVVQTSASAIFSPLGSALIESIDRTRRTQENGFLPKFLSNTEIPLFSLERALELMMDHILVGFSGAQYVIAGKDLGRQGVSMTTNYSRFKVGNLRFITAVSIINCGLIIASTVYLIMSKDITQEEVDYFDLDEPQELIFRTSIWGNHNYESLHDPKCPPKHDDSLQIVLRDRELGGETRSGFRFTCGGNPDSTNK